MTLRLYNTMSRRVEPFTPLDPGRVSLYTCGPTVYNYAHIGNFRTFLFEDVLRRWLEASGYEVFHVMNLTDVDDKTIKGALAAKASLREYVQPYIAAFHEDRQYLRMLDAHEYPRATEFIAPMIALVEDLLAKGIAYRGDDGSTYFAIGRFPDYGKLSRLDTRELRIGAGGGVSSDEYAKEDARDFVLWKASRPDDEAVGAAWDAPFGRGRPGWHLECSAMALDLVGKRFGRDILDIHAGGVDLIFPHHEDEIAQSCAHTGHADFARVWMHGEFLTMAGTKMSKRFGNILTARDLREEHVDAATVRTLLATTHYRQKLDFTDDALAAAREGSRRLGEFSSRLATKAEATSGAFDQIALVLKDEFGAAMDDDLNTPRALAALFEAARAGNRALDEGALPTAAFNAAWDRMCGVLQVVSGAELFTDPNWDDRWAQAKADERREAKAAGDFQKADRIRAELQVVGWEIRDNRDGTSTVQRRR
ncbi:MAG: cysteine--tRNA ligase [Gemmatimonadales bacterium]